MRRNVYVIVMNFAVLAAGGLFLMACAPYPQVGYYGLEDAIANAQSEEEREHYKESLRKVERDVEKANDFIEAIDYCEQSGECMPVCIWNGPYLKDAMDLEIMERRGMFKDIESLVRWWRRVKPPTCGIVERGNEAFR